MSSHLSIPVDYDRHNDEVRAVMAAFDAGNPVRVPMIISGSITNYLHNPDLNRRGLTFKQFFTDPQAQIDAQLAYQHWRRHNLLCDLEMGLPERWQLGVDFQNSYDASWAGCEVTYRAPLPDTLPLLGRDKRRLYDLPRLLPVKQGLIGRGFEFIDYMEDYCKTHEFEGRPIEPPRAFPGEGCDGIFDLAYKLRGADQLLIDMMEDEAYYADLMEWITENLINRIRALRAMHAERWGAAPRGFGFADDAICMLSHDAYRQYVLPYHKRLISEFSGGGKILLHLCGGNMQHWKGLIEELPVGTIDTGFPIDFDVIRGLVGADVVIQGGPTVMLVKDGSIDAIREETKRILNSRAAREGRFVLIAANNMAPCTPVEHIAAMYDAVHEFGRY